VAAKLVKLLRSSHCEYFNAAISQIAHVASEFKSGGSALCEVAKAYALDDAGNQILSGLFLFIHKEAEL